jgi:predicted protein tyrosine phosphatase
MTEIFDGFLFVGRYTKINLNSGADAQDEKQLRANNITHILNVAIGWKMHKIIAELGIYYGEVLIEDSQYERLLPHLEHVFKFIDLAKKLEKNPKILIHCISGIFYHLYFTRQIKKCNYLLI